MAGSETAKLGRVCGLVNDALFGAWTVEDDSHLCLQILCGRHTYTAVSEEERKHISDAANVDVWNHLGCIILGHGQRQVQGRLPVPAVRRKVHQVHHSRVLGVCSVKLPPGTVVTVRLRAQPPAVCSHAMGAEQLHGVQLLHGS